jgi:hypothetical protein
MRAASVVVASVVACWLGAASAIAAKPPDFAQATWVVGKAPGNLGGAWFLYAQAQFKTVSRALPPQLITAAPGPDGGVDLKLLDVQLPKAIYEPFQAANRKPQAWEPSPQDIALLRKEWAKLPPMTDKDWRKSEREYDRVDFMVVTPEKYGETFADQPPDIHQELDGSVFTLVVVEKYRPHAVEPGENVAQAMTRKTMYVVRKTSDSLLEGKQFTGYVAAAPGVPLPISMTGPFRMYRLAKAKTGAAPAAAPPSRPHRGRR